MVKYHFAPAYDLAMNGGINKMSVKSCEKIEKSQVVLTIEVGAPEFEAAIEKAYQKMRKKINVPGFRPGKAPRKIIEGMYGAEVFFEEAINIAFPEAYEAAVKEQELPGGGLSLCGDRGPGDPRRLHLQGHRPCVSRSDPGPVQGTVRPQGGGQGLRCGCGRAPEGSDRPQHPSGSVDREAKEGDTVVIDFEGFLEGKPFEGGKGENFSLELGSHTFVPALRSSLSA